MKLAESNKISYVRIQDPTAKPPLIKKSNLAAGVIVGALNGVYKITNSQDLITRPGSKALGETFYHPLDKMFYNFITNTKSNKFNDIATSFKKWLSPEDTRVIAIGSNLGISPKRMARGAILLAALYTIPKIFIYQRDKKKVNKDSVQLIA